MTQEKKQTAVDYCYEEIIKHIDLSEFDLESLTAIIEIAKGKEMRQIMDAYATVITKYDGVKSWTKIYDEEAESYYNENYCDNKKSNEQLTQQKLF